ncbi:hypothetical protein ABZ746_37505 [Streptomyces sp. NPDC020096]
MDEAVGRLLNSEQTLEQLAADRPAAVPRRFVLRRHEDVTGASGTGVVAWGVLWPDGTASVRWAGERASAVFWQGGVADVEFVHGHNGATEIVWLDEAD